MGSKERIAREKK